MRVWSRWARFLKSSDGFVISTEKIVVLTLVVGALVVGVTTLRITMRSFFLDEVDAIAACSNQVTFGAANSPAPLLSLDMETPDFPTLVDQVTRPTPTPASKEGS